MHTLMEEAKRHKVAVFAISPSRSVWDCEIENGGIRLGWGVVQEISQKQADALIRERENNSFKGLWDFLNRVKLHPAVLHRLALADAFQEFGVSARDALWEILVFQLYTRCDEGDQLSLFSAAANLNFTGPHGLKGQNSYEHMKSDFEAFSLSLRGHPMKILRKMVRKLPKEPLIEVRQGLHGTRVQASGLVLGRDGAATLDGGRFCTLEDETGTLDIVFKKDIYEKYQDVFLGNAFFIVKGTLHRELKSVRLVASSIRVAAREKATFSHGADRASMASFADLVESSLSFSSVGVEESEDCEMSDAEMPVIRVAPFGRFKSIQFGSNKMAP
jgi:error-prone DNA polymerase